MKWILLLILALPSCMTARVSSVGTLTRPTVTIGHIALAPGAGALADSIAAELFNRGYTIMDATEASRVVALAGLQEIELTTPAGLQSLWKSGIDACLVARGVVGYDGQLDSASARVIETATGRVIAAITWQNAWGGARGSPADRIMRKGVAPAASDIADGLAQRLGAPGTSTARIP